MSAYGIAEVHLGPGQTFANIQAAHDASAIKPGDTVYLHSGSYRGYQGISSLKGNSSAWIVITRFQDDIIDISGGWQFMSCEYIKFVNLTFRANLQQTGRLISVDNSGSCETQSRFIKFDSCSFSNVTDPNAITSFKFGGVDNFEVTNCVFKDMPVCSAFDFNVCHAGKISGNRIENCLTGGHIKGGASFITMERNLFLDASKPSWVAFELGGDTGAQFYCPGDKFEVKNLNFYSNIIAGGYRGLALSSAVECNVANNTFYNCGQATMRFLTTSSLYPNLYGNMVYNNIFAFGSSAYINGSTQPGDAAFFIHNIYYSIIDSVFNGPYWDTPDLDKIKDKKPMIYGSGTKMFIDAVNNDFHLAEGSPAIGSGDMIEPYYDFYGNKFTSPRSIGAVAYINPTLVDQKETKIDFLYPNPASDFIEINVGTRRAVSEQCDVKIYNLLGEIQTTPQWASPLLRNCDTPPWKGVEKVRIDVSILAPGMYFVRVGDKISKFMKL
jgi:hypothetical protein